MSVYTTLNKHELTEFMQTFWAGQLTGFRGISEGIENTNYFVDTEQNGKTNQFVLTIFESLDIAELPYFLELTAFLAEKGLPCAHPIANKQQQYLQTLKNKPAALVQRLQGRSIETPETHHCEQVGKVLSQMHLQSQSFTLRRNNPRGYAWYAAAAQKVKMHLDTHDQTLLENELRSQANNLSLPLPSGVIHADLFRDNVLFNNDQISGVIDFYYACDGYFLYDLAITMNDWCSLPDGTLNTTTAEYLLQGYTSIRPLSDAEQAHWPWMLRAAALRFWLSRLVDWHFPRPGVLTHAHDPDVFRDILQHRINSHSRLIQTWF